MRDLVRAREAAKGDEKRARHRLSKFLLRRGLRPAKGVRAWTQAYFVASRNELIKEVLRDYRYIEATGLGVPRKIIDGMRAHNGTEPDLVEEDDRFIVRL